MRKGNFATTCSTKSMALAWLWRLVDLQSPNAGCVIDCGVLVALDHAATFSLEDEELDVDLDMMTRDLFLVTLGVNGSRSGFARKTAQAVAPQNAIDAGV